MDPCPSCASVRFVSRRVHRRGSLAVFLGHVLLVPAVLAGVTATMGVVRPGGATCCTNCGATSG